MKTLVRNAASALILMMAGVSAQARDLNVGVSIAGEFQPGVYGQVNINTMPSYQLMYPQPMLIAPQPAYAVPVTPVYMHVPVVQAQQWGTYCGYYNACSRPVYFVQPQYAPRRHHGYYEGHGHGHGRGHGRGHGHGHGHH